MNVYIAPGGRDETARLIADKLGPKVRLLHDADGAPRLYGSPLNISISHSRHFAAIALHLSARIGIDIEEPRLGQLRRVITKFLAPHEREIWSDRLLEAWTCKEAVFKAAGLRNLPLGAIDLSRPGVAAIPDGGLFALHTVETPDYTLTTAVPLLL